jgi:hypothetical protein
MLFCGLLQHTQDNHLELIENNPVRRKQFDRYFFYIKNGEANNGEGFQRLKKKIIFL